MNKCNIFVRIKNYSSISIRNEILRARQPSPFLVHLTSFHGYPERVSMRRFRKCTRVENLIPDNLTK